ncbi:NAD(P)H-binding protein [Mycolicibacterium iranicum]|uniref:NAD(P)-dependent oxidoreductase n=1 Tax=Mycolicibacterium iranicum TaxID=912594 RepID=A0A178M3X7_MYCIR|nr:NAD(P)H-binding protein [Mycolicibacterium iranicum]OAN41803.1 NAD(P)-dependent oxidoreductase [Mycolicibacterium iranicum]
MDDSTTLVLGASGKSGRRVAARLRLKGLPVRAVSRRTDIAFDWADPSGWNAVLHGVRAVYVVPPAVPGPVHEFAAQAGAAGVRHLVLLSGRGADDWGDSSFGRDMRDAEEAVRASGVPWTILRPNNFAQNFDEELWHQPLLDGELALPAGDVGEPFIDLEDVADVAAHVLTDPGRHTERIYELSGPRSITFEEAVDLISRACGQSISYRRITPQEYVEALVGQGVDRGGAEHVAEMFELMGSSVIAETTEDVAVVLGRPARTFEDYVLRVAVTGAWTR